MRVDLDGLENQTPPPGDDQTPQSIASSQTVVGTSADPNTGYRTSFKRKRDNSPSDFTRSVRPFVAGSDGDSLPHYLTVSPAVHCLPSHIECEYRSLKAGNRSCSKSRVYPTRFSKTTIIGKVIPGVCCGRWCGYTACTPVGVLPRKHAAIFWGRMQWLVLM